MYFTHGNFATKFNSLDAFLQRYKDLGSKVLVESPVPSWYKFSLLLFSTTQPERSLAATT